MKIAIIISNLPADQNIKHHLIKKGFVEKGDHFAYKNMVMHAFDERCTHIDNVDEKIDADLFVFATIHQSASKHPCLTCHPIGNWDKAEFGGKERTIYPSLAAYWKAFYLRLKELATDIDVTLEATHHGPDINKPALFVEIGSSEKQWNDSRFGEIIAQCIIDVCSSKVKEEPTCVVLGGGHYNSAVIKIFEGSEYAIGHVCPKFMLEKLTEDTLTQALEKTIPKAELVALDYKGLGDQKQHVKALLKQMCVRYVKAHELYRPA